MGYKRFEPIKPDVAMFAGMDGGDVYVQKRVMSWFNTLSHPDVGDALDRTLATVLLNSETRSGAAAHLDYLVTELHKVKRNLLE